MLARFGWYGSWGEENPRMFPTYPLYRLFLTSPICFHKHFQFSNLFLNRSNDRYVKSCGTTRKLANQNFFSHQIRQRLNARSFLNHDRVSLSSDFLWSLRIVNLSKTAVETCSNRHSSERKRPRVQSKMAIRTCSKRRSSERKRLGIQSKMAIRTCSKRRSPERKQPTSPNAMAIRTCSNCRLSPYPRKYDPDDQ